MHLIGEIGYSQFLDLNKEEAVHTLPYFRQVKQCEEAERRLNYLLSECRRHFVTVTPPENTEGFEAQLQKIRETKDKAIHLLLEEIQKEIEKQEKFIMEQNLRLKETEDVLNNNKECY
jgi:hypothetical protein